MNKRQFRALVFWTSPFPLLIGLIVGACVGMVFGAKFDSDREMFLSDIQAILLEWKQMKQEQSGKVDKI